MDKKDGKKLDLGEWLETWVAAAKRCVYVKGKDVKEGMLAVSVKGPHEVVVSGTASDDGSNSETGRKSAILKISGGSDGDGFLLISSWLERTQAAGQAGQAVSTQRGLSVFCADLGMLVNYLQPGDVRAIGAKALGEVLEAYEGDGAESPAPESF